MGLINFLASSTGRWVRGAVGAVLLILAFIVGGAGGWILGLLGVVFVAVGVLDVCLVAPLLGKPLRGQEFRALSR
ncbi:MAG: DUF2892 domain-containing protein [Propionibacteriaceae bacterium]|nr:DUF2892 domain-containing protein [Propionibacteriaceae bacterium]